MSERHSELLKDGLKTIREAAAFLGISRSSIYTLMDSGRLAYVRIGTSRRIPHRSLLELAASNLTEAVPA